MRGGKCNMFSSLGCLLLCGSIALALGNAQKLPKGKRPSLKVHINTTSDSILLKFLRPNPNVKLEGFLLGYGSNLSPNQYFPLPAEGKFTEAVVDAEPKYLIVVRPAPPPSRKKSCSGKARSRKPLQLVVGTLTPSSVFLSWGFLINPHHDWTLPSHCPNDRYYTIRYREKDKEKKWVFQLCPATETIVENLKPNTVYEFGVKDNGEGGIWSKIFNHKTVVGSKKVNGKIQSTYDQVHTVPAYVPRKLIPITIIKQVIQNVTHRASTKSPDKTPFGGTILVHLIIPGLNETTVKLPTSIMLEISDAIKTQLAKNETLALPAESKTPEVEKIPAQPVTVTAESVPRTTKPTVSSALEFSEKTLASSEKPWIVPTSKTSEDSKLLPPQTAAQQTTSIPSTPKRRIRPKPPRTKPERTTSPGTITPKIPKSPEPTWTTLAPSKTQFISLKPKIPLTPEGTPTKPAPEPQTLPPSQSTLGPGTLETKPSTLAPPKTKRPGRRPRPKTTPSPDVPKSKPALEPATVPLELSVPTIASKPSKRPKTTHRPDAPQIQPDSKPPKQLLPKPQTPAQPVTPPTKPVFEPVTFETEAPSPTIVPATDLEPVTLRTESPMTTLAPKTSQRPRTRRPRPKHKTTPSPAASQSKLDSEPISPGTYLATTTKRPRRPRPKAKTTSHPEVPQTKLATKTSQRPRRPRPRPKTTPSLQVPQNKSVPATVLEPETPGTTLASETSQQTHRPRPRPKTTPSLEASESKPVPTADLEPVVFRTETWVTTQAPKTSKRTRRPHPKLKTTPTSEAPQTKLVPTTDLEPGPLRTKAPEIVVLPTALEPITLRTKAPETALAPKTVQRTRRPRPRPKTTSSPEAPQTKQVPATSFEPVIHSSEAPETTLAPTELQTLILKPVTSPILEMTQSQPVSEVLESVTLSTESSKEALAPTVTDYLYPSAKTPLSPEEPKTGVVESITNVSEPPETTLETSPLLSQTIIPPSPDEPSTEPAPKQTPRAPPKPKTSPHPRIPQTQPARKVSQHVTSKPKTSPSPEVSYTPPVPRDVLLPPKPDPEVSQSEPAPLETRGSPFIPMISPSTTSEEELQATLAETDQSTQGFFTTRIPLTTELAKTTQAPHRLYTPPVRPRIPDKAHIRPRVKQAPKPSGAGKNVSVDSTHSTKKPGTRRPPLPPRPVPPRRKPLPPNNVTGKPGSAGIISSVRVTSPPLRATLRPTEAPSERTETDEKQPTAPASGEDLGNITDFSSSPTRETDPLGKPRFKGPHVRYIQKPDNRPCSITDSVKRFPKEDATEGNATSPPQNPPTNLTVVTVEGCPSFVILDWDKPLNDTVTEYEVISRENGSFSGKNKSIQITNQTFSTVENLKPDTSYEFQVKPKNPLGEGPPSNTVAFNTESADPRVSEPISAGRDAIWTERPFNSDSYSECKGKQYVKRTWYKKFVGVQLCNSLRYKIYLSDSLTGKFYNIGDQRGHGEDHCQFVDSFLDGRTGQQLSSDQLPTKEGYFRAVRQEPVQFGEIGGHTQINYVQWYECGTTIPGKW
ncbi:target of Nesh-SH3 isoform X6 [Neomonachus schauinslandi]|uniref:Target of Nesh-SH3 isoform X6 n=1 Tax=Neomonachus schauinslandi TaxID=29088 RepID=A0A8M1MNX7_NEOSC|nr:target of Nesh-SH3 isoform X6 [Neomonachus schauinslandi]